MHVFFNDIFNYKKKNHYLAYVTKIDSILQKLIYIYIYSINNEK